MRLRAILLLHEIGFANPDVAIEARGLLHRGFALTPPHLRGKAVYFLLRLLAPLPEPTNTPCGTLFPFPCIIQGKVAVSDYL